MFKGIKDALKPIIILSISLLLFPTIAEMIGKNFDERNRVFSFLANSSFVIQSIGIIITSLSGTLFVFILYKEKKVKEVLVKAGIRDAIWDLEHLKYHTRFVFYKIQNSWENDNITSLQDYATPEFILWFKDVLKSKGNKNYNEVNISDTRIICCEDFLNNDKDKFVGYIMGYLIADGDTDSSYKKQFSEEYHFVRFQNDWLLSKIGSGNIFNIAFSTNKFEQ